MLPNGRRIGVHLPLAAGMVRAADRAVAIGASAVQVFVDNPTSWQRRTSLPRELPAFRERLASHDIAPVSVHAPYLVNLGSPDDETWSRSIEVLVNELAVASAYGASFLNVHVGSHRGQGHDAGAVRVGQCLAEIIGRAADQAGILLVLENGSGAGFALGSTPAELGAIARAAARAGVPDDRLGFCLDTAHLWGAGADISTAAGVDALLAQVDDGVGLSRVRMVHLNDSRSARGTGADRHEHLGGGAIGADGLARFLTHPGLAHVAYLVETPGMEEGWDAVNLARAADLAAGRPLAPLPPHAFQTASARGRAAPPAAEAPDEPEAEADESVAAS